MGALDVALMVTAIAVIILFTVLNIVVIIILFVGTAVNDSKSTYTLPGALSADIQVPP